MEVEGRKGDRRIERERERQRDRERQRETETERDRETERQRDGKGRQTLANDDSSCNVHMFLDWAMGFPLEVAFLSSSSCQFFYHSYQQ